MEKARRKRKVDGNVNGSVECLATSEVSDR